MGESESKLKGAPGRLAATGLGITAQAMSDTPGKLAAVAYAFEHFEIASYRLPRLVAERADDTETIDMADRVEHNRPAAPPARRR
jgi:ferritin-like metal-binding protein YciE